MEADSMGLPARLVNKFLPFLFLLACGNNKTSTQQQMSLPLQCVDSVNLQMNNNGLMCHNGKPFSGRLYKLYSESKDTQSIYGYFEGAEQGLRQEFFIGHRLKAQRYFEKGVKTGIYKTWWGNGKPQLSCYFEKGEYNGTFSEWNFDGVLVKELHYKMGHEEGSQKQFYDNGKIRTNYVMKNGKRYGLLGTKNCVNVSDSIFQK